MTNIVSMPITHQVELDDVFFEDIICTMLEGGSNYWIGHIMINHPGGLKPKDIPPSMWAANALNNGGTVIFYIPNEEDESDKITLVKNMLVEGLTKWAENYQNHVSIVTERGKCTIDAGDIDADQADIILQYALFNDVIFG
jgi:hypothetical protein